MAVKRLCVCVCVCVCGSKKESSASVSLTQSNTEHVGEQYVILTRIVTWNTSCSDMVESRDYKALTECTTNYCTASAKLITRSITINWSFTIMPRTLRLLTPFLQIDIIGAVVIVWRVRGNTVRSVLCNIVCNNCAQCDAHTYEQTNSSLDWVLSHWAHFTVLRFIFVLCITVCCMHA